MENISLRQIAKEAKARLKNRSSIDYQSKRLSDLNNSTKQLNIQTVMEIVDSKEIIANPIQRLIDKEYYERLSETAKQRYILNVADNYLKLKRMYINSKTLSKK